MAGTRNGIGRADPRSVKTYRSVAEQWIEPILGLHQVATSPRDGSTATSATTCRLPVGRKCGRSSMRSSGGSSSRAHFRAAHSESAELPAARHPEEIEGFRVHARGNGESGSYATPAGGADDDTGPSVLVWPMVISVEGPAVRGWERCRSTGAPTRTPPLPRRLAGRRSCARRSACQWALRCWRTQSGRSRPGTG